MDHQLIPYPKQPIHYWRDKSPEIMHDIITDWLDQVLAKLGPLAKSDQIVNLATSSEADALIDAAWAESKRRCSLIPIKRLCDLVGEHL